jgi:hypothetical protein
LKSPYLKGDHYTCASKILSVLVAAALIFNGILNYLFGEFFSEGLALLATYLFLFSRLNFEFRIQRSVRPFLFVICTILFYNLIDITEHEMAYRFLFFYPYIFFSLIPLLAAGDDSENNFLIRILVIFSCLSSMYALAQRLGLNTLLPLESATRATGLSRSSLNLSGCLLLMFALSFFILSNNLKKWLALIIIFIGILSAGGRGAIVGAIVLTVLGTFAFWSNIKNIIYVASFTSLSVLLFNDWLFRAFSAFNFANDQSNIQRLSSYAKFLEEFQFLGRGIGTASPAVSRFGPATGFESFALNTIYELGIPFVILISISFIFYFHNLKNSVKKDLIFFGAAISPIFFGQQILGTPSVFCCMVLVCYFIAYRTCKVGFK